MQKLLNILDTLFAWISEVEPIEQPQRFGNKAFKTWWERVRDVSMGALLCWLLSFVFTQNADDLIKELLPDDLVGAVVELKVYLLRK